MDGLLRCFTGRDRPSETAGAVNLRNHGGQPFKGRPGDRQAACADGGSPATGLNAGFSPNSVQSRSGVTTEDESKAGQPANRLQEVINGAQS